MTIPITTIFDILYACNAMWDSFGSLKIVLPWETKSQKSSANDSIPDIVHVTTTTTTATTITTTTTTTECIHGLQLQNVAYRHLL